LSRIKTLFEWEDKQQTGIKKDELNSSDITILEKLEVEKKMSCSFGFRGEKENELKISTNSHIGSVKLEGPDVRINILPKVFENQMSWKNTNIFLDYTSSGNLDYYENAKNFYTGTYENTLLNRLHVNLISECEELMKQGLLKSYVVHTENTSSMRGKLLMQYQMLNDASKKPKFFCEFDELEYDSVENRVILQALTVVERTSDNQDVRLKAMDLAQKLSGVVQKISVPYPERKKMMQSYNRQNLRYEGIHDTCQKIIEESGIGDIYKGEESHVVPVFYDMNELFETFVQRLFEKTLKKEYSVETQYEQKAWEGKGELGPRKMRPDITLWKGKICEEIIDVKYKIKNISTGDLYQLGFYMHEFGKKNDDGKEIESAFAITPEFEDAVNGTYVATKTRKKVYVKRINVEAILELIKNKEDEELERQVKTWIEPIVE